MTTSSNWKPLGIVTCSALALCAGALLSSCEKKSEETPRPSAAVTPIAPATAEPAAEKAAPVAEKPVAQEPATAIGDPTLPILHLAMDDKNADTAVVDRSDYAHHQVFLDETGTAHTTAHSVPGVVENALSFDGVDDAITIPATDVGAAFAAGQDFTVSFWWRSEHLPFPDGYQTIVSNFTGKDGGFGLYQRGNSDGTDRRVYLNFYVPGNPAPILSHPIRLAENVVDWHHYAFQREDATLRVYFDGALQAEYTDPTANEALGAGQAVKISPAGRGSKGSMDELNILPSALPASAIGELAQTTPGLDDLFSLAEKLGALKADAASDSTEIARVEAALKAKMDAQEGYPMALSDEVELLGFKYALFGGNQYEWTMAFRTSAPLEKDFHIYVHGVVDKSHVSKIPERNGKPSQLQKWGFKPTPPTSSWTPGEIIVVRFQAQAADVPYEMSINLMYNDPDSGWMELSPDFLRLGWQASL